MHLKGLNDDEICSKLGVKKECLISWRDRRKISSNKVKTETQVIKLYKKGLSDKEISEKLGVGIPIVSTWRKKHKLPTHQSIKTKNFTKTIIPLRRKGLTPREIFESTGIDIGIIYRIFDKLKKENK